MIRMLRFYSLAGLVAIVVTLLMLFWFYRQVAIDGIVQLAERTNLTLARSALNSMGPELVEFLRSTGELRAHERTRPDLPPTLAAGLRQMMQDRTVVRVKLLNRRGVVVYSSAHQQIGSNQGTNNGFIAAIRGEVSNSLIYRDTFNGFDGATEEDNLMQTYLPVRASLADPIEGVFEIYTDVNHLAGQAERTEFIILIGALLILGATYAVVMLVTWRAGSMIELQQRTIRERTQTLELLSAQMLKSEESHKKKLAFELHEGLAQTLSAIKLHLENLRTGDAPVVAVIPALREAIDDVRTIATELRPSSIDDVGLLLTLERVCRETEQRYSPLRITMNSGLQEADIPERLKIILYRIVVSVLADLARHTDNRRINLSLWKNGRTLFLMIDDTAREDLERTAVPLARIDPQLSAGFARMEELTTLSGGEFGAAHHAGGGTILRASWHIHASSPTNA